MGGSHDAAHAEVCEKKFPGILRAGKENGMSERELRVWIGVLGCVMYFGSLAVYGQHEYFKAEKKSWAEMKRWQDQWYSKPIVEHQTVFQDHFYRVDGSIEECESHTLPKSFAISKMDCQQVTPPQPSKARKPRISDTDKITPFRCLDGQILPKDGPCPAPLTMPVLTAAGGDPDYLRDVPAKEITLEKGWGKTKPCDPPVPQDSAIACFDWQPIHMGWTCEDKRRILQVSEDGRYHCILPPGQSAEPHDSDKCVCKRDERGIEYDCVCPIVPAPKPIGCEGIFLEGYGDQVHWAKF